MTEIIIIDDEVHCTSVLENLIGKMDSGYIITGVFNDPVQGLNFIQKNPPDLLFLDIEMPNLNGFALLDKLLPIDFDIIFTTAYDQYAIKAFKYSAINYLQKPITERNIVESLSTWEKRRKKISDEQWKLFQSHLESEDEPIKIALPTGVGYTIVEVKNIVRCKADDNYTSFYLADENKILISRTLKEVEGILSNRGFFRVHQSHLINSRYVNGVSRQDGGCLIMHDDAQIPVSRQKRNLIDEILESTIRFK
ncbi:MAG TPA: LytTR family DNA-binding domain-containing protein [Aequorivita sp.]|nr:LytTR family DNA-binding domain-containing protein [Aequorivita sp.]